MRVGAIKILISNCTTGIYLRWWFNGWHYYNFTNAYEIEQRSESMDTQVSQVFSVISKIERPTKLKIDYYYRIKLEGITALNIGGFTGLLMAERVEMYEPVGDVSKYWREVTLTRGNHVIRDTGAPGYILEFEISRKELPVYSSVLQKSQKLYIGDTLCDLDDSEMIPQNKQVNDIAEMQDRQSDFTAQFKIRKTRAMRDLFELSGEVGINTTYPYQKKTCKLIQDGIEIITGGNIILDKVDDQYYYVAIYSGNIDFFSTIDGLTINDLLLAGTNHWWLSANQAASNTADLDYVYPLCEPSDDGGMCPMPPATADYVQLYGGWIWAFIKAKAIFDEIILNAGYTATGAILTDEKYLKLFMPITDLSLSNVNIKPWLYSLHAWQNLQVMTAGVNALDCFNAYIEMTLGDDSFRTLGIYYTRYAARYKFRVRLLAAYPGYTLPLHVWIFAGGVQVDEMTDDGTLPVSAYYRSYTGEYVAVVGEAITFCVSYTGLSSYDLQVLDITDVAINYSSWITPRLHLPKISQTEFIKMICNLFALVPETNAKDKIIKFWNYQTLYDNIANARNWSAYLSEREDEVEFVLGDYSRDNYLRYKESDDVVKDAGTGIMIIEDDNLKAKGDIVNLEVSTCDEVIVLTDVAVSRIAFNKYDIETSTYIQEKSIDARLVYVDYIKDPYTSPPYEKTFGIRNALSGGVSTDIITPRKASSLEIAFSTLMPYYASLQNILNKTNIRRAKFNLPVYEVARFRHDIPIYLSQYKTYFYVNKILNYIPGKLCTIELIKL
jgi:hypothetical protein